MEVFLIEGWGAKRLVMKSTGYGVISLKIVLLKVLVPLVIQFWTNYITSFFLCKVEIIATIYRLWTIFQAPRYKLNHSSIPVKEVTP